MASSSSGSSVRKASPVPSADSTHSVEAPIIATPTAAVEKQPDDSSKLRTFVGILRKYAIIPLSMAAVPETFI